MTKTFVGDVGNKSAGGICELCTGVVAGSRQFFCVGVGLFWLGDGVVLLHIYPVAAGTGMYVLIVVEKCIHPFPDQPGVFLIWIDCHARIPTLYPGTYPIATAGPWQSITYLY